MPRARVATSAVAALLFLLAAALQLAPRPAMAAGSLIGSGSSFAGIELQEWSKDVGSPPYNLNVNYQSSSSGEGRQNFRDGTVDFAVSDIRYNKYDVNPPDPSTFEYIPVTAGGVAFMYNLQGHGFGANAAPIRLTSLTVCGIFTGAIPYWDDPSIAADNPGVTLPHVAITPVVRSDPAGTNYVLEEYCIQLHNDLYSKFALAVSKATGTDYPDDPTSNWPILTPLVAAQGSEGAADTVAGSNNEGYITFVETGYATQRHFPVASIQNDTGTFVQPTPDAVATALSYATQQPDGTHVLNFTPGNPGAYNPSTYSYMLVRLNAPTDKGAAITQFAEYCLTIGQSHATQLSYASVGRSLILYGLDRLKAVPGYTPPTNDEMAAIPAAGADPNAGSGGLSQAAVAASGGGSSGGGGAGGGTAGSGGGATTASGGGAGTAGGTGGAGAPSVAAGGATAAARIAGGGTRSGAALARAGGSAIDPSASLGAATGPLGQTGVESDVLFALAGALVLGGEVTRRGLRRRWLRA